MTQTTVAQPASAQESPRAALAALGLAPVLSYADRFGYLPVTTAIALQTGIASAAIALSVTIYLVAYGACQPLWGGLSDRFGRRPVLLAGMAGLAAADLAVTVIPGGTALVLLRAVAGVMAGALLPTTLAAVGDLVAPAERHGVVSRLVAWASVGGAAAMLLGGVLAARYGWRLALLALSGSAVLGAAVTAIRLPRVPRTYPLAGGALRELWAVRSKAARLYGFAFVEGVVMLGAFPLIVPALRQHGQTSASTGITMAVYGFAAVAGSMLVRRLSAGGPARPVLAGGALLVAGLVAATALAASPLPLAALASACLGAAFSLFHARFQVMATQLAPNARGTGTGMFVGMVFTGAAVGTAAGAALSGSLGYNGVFAATAGLAILVAAAGYYLARTPAE